MPFWQCNPSIVIWQWRPRITVRFSLSQCQLCNMQDDLFGNLTPQIPADPDSRDSTDLLAGLNPNRIRPAPSVENWSELAQRLPALLRFGVSTWSYPGWNGLVWDGDYDPGALSKNGLEAYHRHPRIGRINALFTQVQQLWTAVDSFDTPAMQPNPADGEPATLKIYPPLSH